jgi:transposase
LGLHLPWLDDQWASGCRKGAELWRRLKARGFRGSLRVISEWATRRRRAEKADARNLQRIPSARTIARLMTIGRDLLTKAETVTVAAIEAGVPTLIEAREIIAEFHLMIRRKTEAGLIPGRREQQTAEKIRVSKQSASPAPKVIGNCSQASSRDKGLAALFTATTG